MLLRRQLNWPMITGPSSSRQWKPRSLDFHCQPTTPESCRGCPSRRAHMSRFLKSVGVKNATPKLRRDVSTFQQSHRSRQVELLSRQLELEKKLAVLVEDAYCLSAEERSLLRTTRPVRDPLDVLEAKILGSDDEEDGTRLVNDARRPGQIRRVRIEKTAACRRRRVAYPTATVWRNGIPYAGEPGRLGGLVRGSRASLF